MSFAIWSQETLYLLTINVNYLPSKHVNVL
jgi:hypothetical protein